MGYTKGDLVEGAFNEAGMSSYVFDMSPEENQQALRRLDSMMADWSARGIKLGYPLPSTPTGSELTDAAGIPDYAYEAVITNLALKLMPSYGKTPAQLTLSNARASYLSMMGRLVMPQPLQMPASMPRGAGSKSLTIDGGSFFPVPTEPITNGPDSSADTITI